jgi:aspartate carbamoyltransferase catalytic subunit
MTLSVSLYTSCSQIVSAKQEIKLSISDSIAVMAGYADVVVLRHPEPGAVSVSTVVCV